MIPNKTIRALPVGTKIEMSYGHQLGIPGMITGILLRDKGVYYEVSIVAQGDAIKQLILVQECEIIPMDTTKSKIGFNLENP